MVSEFTKRRLSILLFILRLSWGCNKKEAIIPRQGDFEMVGVGKGHIKAELDWLIEAKVISRDGDIYRFNKDYDQWRVSRCNGYRHGKVTDMVTYNLKHRSPKVTEVVTLVSEEVTGTVTLGYRNGNKPVPKSRSHKERLKESSNNKESSSKFPITKEVMAEIALLYEGEIGKITKFAGEALNDAIREYPAQDIKDAIKIAATGEKRNWRYVLGILENWKRDGREGADGESSPLDAYGGRNACISLICRKKGKTADDFRGKSDDEVLAMVKELGVLK